MPQKQVQKKTGKKKAPAKTQAIPTEAALPALGTSLMPTSQIREEGNGTKTCFTDFSFKAFTISAAGLGLIARELYTNDFIALGSIGIVGLLLLVIRVGNYKYATSNRNFAYELHILRCRHYESSYDSELQSIGWEEAMFAWRVVQASVFETIYDKLPVLHYPRNRLSGLSYQWWNTRQVSFTKGDAAKIRYYAGSYLKHMQASLYLLAIFASALILLKLIDVYRTPNASSGLRNVYLAAWSITLVCLAWKGVVHARQRTILESELLSIQSSAVVWRASCIAHLRAVKVLKEKEPVRYRGFTSLLGIMAFDLCKHIENIHVWMSDEYGAVIDEAVDNVPWSPKVEELIDKKAWELGDDEFGWSDYRELAGMLQSRPAPAKGSRIRVADDFVDHVRMLVCVAVAAAVVGALTVQILEWSF